MTKKNKQTGKKWGVPGLGKYWKRLLHRAWRRYYKNECRGIRGKEPTELESEVDWRAT